MQEKILDVMIKGIDDRGVIAVERREVLNNIHQIPDLVKEIGTTPGVIRVLLDIAV